MPQGEYTLGELKVVVDQNSARLTDGTLAGSILSLNRAIANVRANTDKPLWEIVNAATLNPAVRWECRTVSARCVPDAMQILQSSTTG